MVVIAASLRCVSGLHHDRSAGELALQPDGHAIDGTAIKRHAAHSAGSDQFAAPSVAVALDDERSHAAGQLRDGDGLDFDGCLHGHFERASCPCLWSGALFPLTRTTIRPYEGSVNRDIQKYMTDETTGEAKRSRGRPKEISKTKLLSSLTDADLANLAFVASTMRGATRSQVVGEALRIAAAALQPVVAGISTHDIIRDVLDASERRLAIKP